MPALTLRDLATGGDADPARPVPRAGRPTVAVPFRSDLHAWSRFS